ncbi:MAG: ribosome small subunit-dependent GTPase A [Acholeplasmataceae bacterium]|nr:ribosome small subunit-dependent GTPase A [Acholeplasmataceae bacterium]
MKKALIIKLIGGNYTLVDLDTKEEFQARARGGLRYIKVEPGSVFHRTVSQRTKKETEILQVSPKVGDYCYYDDSEDVVLITEILPRENELSRPDISNVDQLLLTFSAVEPDFSFNLLDKFLVLAYKNDLKPTLLVTKIDLINNEDLKNLKANLSYYEKLGIKIFYVNSLDLSTTSKEEIFLENKITVLAGQTGVGKSTFLNAIKPELDIKTGEISKALGRGRHTTRHTELYKIRGGYIADTPGFSKLDLDIFEFGELKWYYPDFYDLSPNCRFTSSCNHLKEPGCEVTKLVNTGDILQSRYDNYVRFIDEIKSKKRIY